MKLQNFNILRNKNDLETMLSDVQDILNLGLYQGSEITSAPTDTPGEAESRVYYSGTDKRLYFYVNGVWNYASLRDEQSGWSYITEVAATSVSATVTFPTAFSTAPLVFVSYIGSRLISDGTPTGPAWFTGALTLRYTIGYAVSNTGFTAGIIQSANANLGTTYYSAYSWRALIT